MNSTAYALIVIGALLMLGSALNWSIVTRSGKLLNRIFGDAAARAIYFIGGVVVFLVGVGQLLGIA